MFFKLILENAGGDRIDMTTTANEYMTSSIEGLNPPVGTISTSSYAGTDGSYLNNAFIEKRNVVIHFEMRGPGVEARRHQLYKVVKPSRYIKIYYATAGIDVFAEGYVESCEVSIFEQLVTGQISILCPDIYWYSTESVMAYYSQITGAFTFPFPTESTPEPSVTPFLRCYGISNTISVAALRYTLLHIQRISRSSRPAESLVVMTTTSILASLNLCLSIQISRTATTLQCVVVFSFACWNDASFIRHIAPQQLYYDKRRTS